MSVDSKQNPATDSAADTELAVNPDPYEALNRKIYAFNSRFDDAIGKPVADGYVKAIPAPVRRSVTNFFNNLWYCPCYRIIISLHKCIPLPPGLPNR